MSENEEDVREAPDSSFDQDQQHMFGNENQSAPDATRPHAGMRADPALPDIPTTAGEGAAPLVKQTEDDEQGDKP
jgi:hypothetical protein